MLKPKVGVKAAHSFLYFLQTTINGGMKASVKISVCGLQEHVLTSAAELVQLFFFDL